MERMETGCLPAEMAAVRSRIDAWRETRKPGAPMPLHLWAAAVALARQHGLYPIARGLQVDYGALKKRMLAAPVVEMVPARGAEASTRAFAPKNERLASPTREATEGVQAGFVEFDAAQVFGRSEVAGAVVEMERPDGARMVIRLSAHERLDVVGLGRSFWRSET